jgi:hypothetical protein
MYGKGDSVDLMAVAQVRNQSRTPVNMVINFLNSRGTVKIARTALFIEFAI